jgi:hypothetical protein
MVSWCNAGSTVANQSPTRIGLLVADEPARLHQFGFGWTQRPTCATVTQLDRSSRSVDADLSVLPAEIAQEILAVFAEFRDVAVSVIHGEPRVEHPDHRRPSGWVCSTGMRAGSTLCCTTCPTSASRSSMTMLTLAPVGSPTPGRRSTPGPLSRNTRCIGWPNFDAVEPRVRLPLRRSPPRHGTVPVADTVGVAIRAATSLPRSPKVSPEVAI